VDPQLESWELDGLYVVDGSVLPTSLVVNPQMTIMAFATRAAEWIDARLAGLPRRTHTSRPVNFG
jgi:choline dehydrogenase-like flavoprotein